MFLEIDYLFTIHLTFKDAIVIADDLNFCQIKMPRIYSEQSVNLDGDEHSDDLRNFVLLQLY